MPLLIMLENYLHKKKKKIQISLFKLTNYVAAEFKELLNATFSQKLIESIIYYAKYDKRSDYKNFNELLFSNN